MKIIVLAAAEFETEPLAKNLHLKRLQSYGFTKDWVGNSYRLVQTNIGKVHAAAVTQYVIDHDNPEWIINVGISGGFMKEVSLGDIVMPTHVIQYDLDQTKLGYPLGRIHKVEKIKLPLMTIRGNHSWKKGICLTGDKVLSDQKEGGRLYQLFHPAVVDMELGSIAQVCYMNGIKLMALKSPVDIVEKEEVASFATRLDLSMIKLSNALKELLACLQK